MRAVLTLALVTSLAVNAGCVTTNALANVRQPSLPVLIGTTIADLVVVGLLSSQVENFSVGATVAASLAITAADVAVGCILGACAPLRP